MATPLDPDTPPLTGRRSGVSNRLHRVLRAAALTTVLIAVAGCASSTGSEATTDATALPPTSAVVRIVDGKFDPRQVEVAVGGSVTWVNDDLTDHQLLSTTPNVIQSPLIGKAGSWTGTFGQPGEYRYYCNIHNSMKGEVIVR